MNRILARQSLQKKKERLEEWLKENPWDPRTSMVKDEIQFLGDMEMALKSDKDVDHDALLLMKSYNDFVTEVNARGYDSNDARLQLKTIHRNAYELRKWAYTTLDFLKEKIDKPGEAMREFYGEKPKQSPWGQNILKRMRESIKPIGASAR